MNENRRMNEDQRATAQEMADRLENIAEDLSLLVDTLQDQYDRGLLGGEVAVDEFHCVLSAFNFVGFARSGLIDALR